MQQPSSSRRHLDGQERGIIMDINLWLTWIPDFFVDASTLSPNSTLPSVAYIEKSSLKPV
jgi:hypothetical protein